MFEITMASPGKNALGTEAMRTLLDRLGEADGRPILLTGDGDAFSAGLNLKEVASLDDAGMETFLRLLGTLMSTLFTYPGPTVALVNGHAIAGGCVLALCCDHRVAARATKLRIGLNEVALGLRYPPIILALVRRRVPLGALEEVVLGAGLHDAEGALRLGLLDELADDAAGARVAAMRKLSALAAHPPMAYAAAKMDLRGSAVALSHEDERRFVAEVLPAWTSSDLKARIAKVLAR